MDALVRARREPRPDGDRLVLEVADTGVGLTEVEAPHSDAAGGFGVQQVRERLHTLHGERGTLDLAAAPDGGTRATVTLPL